MIALMGGGIVMVGSFLAWRLYGFGLIRHIVRHTTYLIHHNDLANGVCFPPVGTRDVVFGGLASRQTRDSYPNYTQYPIPNIFLVG